MLSALGIATAEILPLKLITFMSAEGDAMTERATTCFPPLAAVCVSWHQQYLLRGFTDNAKHSLGYKQVFINHTSNFGGALS
jgi:hypothetical protein